MYRTDFEKLGENQIKSRMLEKHRKSEIDNNSKKKNREVSRERKFVISDNCKCARVLQNLASSTPRLLIVIVNVLFFA